MVYGSLGHNSRISLSRENSSLRSSRASVQIAGSLCKGGFMNSVVIWMQKAGGSRWGRILAWGLLVLSLVNLVILGLMAFHGGPLTHVIHATHHKPRIILVLVGWFGWFLLRYGVNYGRREWLVFSGRLLLCVVSTGMAFPGGRRPSYRHDGHSQFLLSLNSPDAETGPTDQCPPTCSTHTHIGLRSSAHSRSGYEPDVPAPSGCRPSFWLVGSS